MVNVNAFELLDELEGFGVNGSRHFTLINIMVMIVLTLFLIHFTIHVVESVIIDDLLLIMTKR